MKRSLWLVCVHVCSVAHLYPSLWDPLDCSPLGSSVHGILQARILEWVAISSSRGSSQPRDQTHVSCISCIGRQILYHCTTWEAFWLVWLDLKEWSGGCGWDGRGWARPCSGPSESCRELGLGPWNADKACIWEIFISTWWNSQDMVIDWPWEVQERWPMMTPDLGFVYLIINQISYKCTTSSLKSLWQYFWASGLEQT